MMSDSTVTYSIRFILFILVRKGKNVRFESGYSTDSNNPIRIEVLNKKRKQKPLRDAQITPEFWFQTSRYMDKDKNKDAEKSKTWKRKRETALPFLRRFLIERFKSKKESRTFFRFRFEP